MTNSVKIPFTKLETIGNDFVLIDQNETGLLEWADVAVQVCQRRYSIGSDGLLVIWRLDDQIHLRFFNPDGTEDFCGNGLRCAAWYAWRQGWVEPEFAILQLGKKISMTINPEGRVKATMPPASFEPKDIPMRSNVEMIDQRVCGVVGTAITTGSAHFIVFADEFPSEHEFQRLGPLIENDDLFPERISVMWVKAISDRHLTMRIWERGVGETLGCGTGATASACVWFRKMGLSGDVLVESKGGQLEISMDSWESEIHVECDPEELFKGHVFVTCKVSTNLIVGR